MTPYGSSWGTCATASSRQTGRSGTRSGGAGDRRPVPREGGFAIMLQETGIATRAQEMHMAAALRDKGYTPFFSSHYHLERGRPPHRGHQQVRGRA